VDLDQRHNQKAQPTDQKSEIYDVTPKTSYILVAIDGTWPQAKEMYSAMSPFLIPPGIQVKLVSPEDETNIYKLRTEPTHGLMTTHECLAKALGILESDPNLTSNLLKPLQLMVELQAKNNPSLQQRLGPDGFYVKGNKKPTIDQQNRKEEETVGEMEQDNDGTRKRTRTQKAEDEESGKQKKPKLEDEMDQD
jgi:hypothetical protein